MINKAGSRRSPLPLLLPPELLLYTELPNFYPDIKASGSLSKQALWRGCCAASALRRMRVLVCHTGRAESRLTELSVSVGAVRELLPSACW